MSRAQVAPSKINALALCRLLLLCTALFLPACGGPLQPHALDPVLGQHVVNEFEAAFISGWAKWIAVSATDRGALMALTLEGTDHFGRAEHDAAVEHEPVPRVFEMHLVAQAKISVH